MIVEKIVLLAIASVCFYFILNEKYKRNKTLKNIIFTTLLIDVYFFMVFKVNEQDEIFVENLSFINYFLFIFFFILTIIIIIIIWKFGMELLKENKVTDLIWMLSYIVLIFSFIYFIIYYYNNKAFMYAENKDWYELAFDFLYYSFNRGLTFGGGTLEPMSFLAKLSSMVQTILFFFVIGKALISNNRSEKI